MKNVRWQIAQWAERRWWRQYLKKKSVTEYLSWKRQYWQEFLVKIGLNKKSLIATNMIDLGSGPAGIFMLFPQATALDPLLDVYEKDLHHFNKSNYPSNTFITSSIEDFEPNTTYDTLFCINAINHVSSIQQGMEKINACAHANSTLVISIDAHNHQLLKKIFQLFPGDILHPHQYSLMEYQALLEQYGWKTVKSFCLDKGFIFNYYVIVAQRN